MVEFLGGYGLGIFLDYRLREAVLVINVFGFCDFGSASGFSIHLQSGFQPLLYMPFILMRNKGNDRTTEKNYGIPKILLGYPDLFVSMNLKGANCL